MKLYTAGEDLDSDNVVSWEEFKGPKGASLEEAMTATAQIPEAVPQQEEGATNLFAALDSNMDGELSLEEFHVSWHKPPRSSREDIFQREDLDSDNVLSWQEFNGPKGPVDPMIALSKNLFVVMDDDTDALISREEFIQIRGNVELEKQEALFDTEDKDSDGFISWDEFSGPKGTAPPVYNVFALLDTDEDGFISNEEFMVEDNALGTEEQFEIEDADKDGRISFDEFTGPKIDGNGAAEGGEEAAPQREL